MSLPLELLIYERPSAEKPPQHASTLALRGRTELGRQETTAEALYSSSWRETERYWRVVIARGTEQTIGRHHVLVEMLADGRLQLTNTSTRSTVQIDGGPSLARWPHPNLRLEVCPSRGGAVPRAVAAASSFLTHSDRSAR